MKKQIVSFALLLLAACAFAIGPPPTMTFYGIVTATSGTAIGQTLNADLNGSAQSTVIANTTIYTCGADACNYYITIGRAPGDTTSTNVVFTVNGCNIATGTYASGAAVRLDMTLPNGCLCGDGITAGSEVCDSNSQACTVNGYAGTGACNGQCTGYEACMTTESCGDGIVNGNEACDDAGTTSGDGCSATCAIETGYQCSGTPSACTPICGDQLIVGSEVCDSNSQACTVNGYAGTGACNGLCSGYDTCIATESCGDGTCNGDETCSSCAADCGACPPSCGDAICNGDETCSTCPGDCGACPPSCGDGTCNNEETCDTCEADCGACPDTTPPFIAINTPANGVTYSSATLLVNITSDGNNVWYEWNGTNTTYTVPVLVAFPAGQNTLVAYANDTAGNSNTTNVTFFVAFCGDAICNNGEACGTCPGDCGACPATPSGGGNYNGGGFYSASYITPPPAPPAPSCGDGTCNGDETCSSCAADCGACPAPPPAPPTPFCGDGTCDGRETCATCAVDCGACRPEPVLGTGAATEELAAEVPTNTQPQPLSIAAQIVNALGGEANLPLVAGGAVLGLLLLALALFLLLGRRKKKGV